MDFNEHVLVEMMSQMTSLNEEEKQAIRESFPIQHVSRDSFLLKQGQVARRAYFVIKGCVREYHLQDGEEVTTAFFTENMSAANFGSLASQKPSKSYLVCSEETTLAVLDVEKEKELYRKFPRFESFCRAGMEEMMGQKQEQLSTFISLKPEQRYEKLVSERPDLLNRVPQFQIASFLGIKPETLSRIRRRLSKN